MRRRETGEGGSDGNGSTADHGEGGVPRRALLRSLSAAGVAGSLAGCLGTIDRDYEATPVGLPGGKARNLGYDPVPTVRTITESVDHNLGVGAVTANLTSYALQYTYRGHSDDQSQYKSEYDDGYGYSRHKRVNSATGLGQGVFGCGSMPQARVAGRSVNPVSGWSVVETVQRRADLIATITGATVPDDPSIDTITPDQTVAEPRSLVGVLDAGFLPESVELFGQSTGLRHLFISQGGDSDLKAQFLSVAKTEVNRDTVFAAYVGERTIDGFGNGERRLIGEDGLFTRSQVQGFLDRFIPVLPVLREVPQPATSQPTTPASPGYEQLVDEWDTVHERLLAMQSSLVDIDSRLLGKLYIRELGRRIRADEHGLAEDDPALARDVVDAAAVIGDESIEADLTEQESLRTGIHDLRRRLRTLERRLRDRDAMFPFDTAPAGTRPSVPGTIPTPLPPPTGGGDRNDTEIAPTTTSPPRTATPEPDCECVNATVYIKAIEGDAKYGTAEGLKQAVKKVLEEGPDGVPAWGHAWIEVHLLKRCYVEGEEVGAKVEKTGWGFYAKSAVKGAFYFQGQIQNEWNLGADWEFHEVVDCTDERLGEMYRAIRNAENDPPRYNAYGYNCVHWALEMFEKGTGERSKIDFPVVIGGGKDAITTPTELCQKIEAAKELGRQ